jgi:hypothetical protein
MEPGFDSGEPFVLLLWPPADFVYSCSISFSISFVRLSLSCSRLSLSRALIRASMVGCQFNYSYGEDFVFANKRRHGGKEERNSDLLINIEVEESDEIDMAIRSEKGDQNNQQPSCQGCPSHGIQRVRTRFSIGSAAI